ncbi:cation transporter [Bacteroides sp. 214]|uniref:cation diffusion facilitator family transporter n=1 Tax=Bacteroides sp. 214 TaxID=2302935 RepID=UPI0013D55863|nr:cation diffusion facilitator family transporter [Bacteroides sp. 214]NDW11599.1 cation transporter [Bacteroides sp. 214]
MSEKEKRDRILIKTSWVSTIGNAFLSIAKIVIGLLAGSLAVVGDGIDSATDVVISIVMIFTAKIMNKPPSPKYVYGYEKAEGIATKVLSLVIFYAGVQMLVTSVQSLFDAEAKELPSTLAIYVTVISIVGKLLLSLYQHRQGARIGSSLLIANAKNMQNDVLISVGVLLGLFFTFVLELPILDSVASLIISLFILKTSISIFMESNVELMDGVKDEGIYDKIFESVRRVEGVDNPHRVRSRLVGGMYVIVLDVEMDGNITLNEAHARAELVEKEIRNSIENIYDITVHAEPYGEHSPEERFGMNEKMI